MNPTHDFHVKIHVWILYSLSNICCTKCDIPPTIKKWVKNGSKMGPWTQKSMVRWPMGTIKPSTSVKNGPRGVLGPPWGVRGPPGDHFIGKNMLCFGVPPPCKPDFHLSATIVTFCIQGIEPMPIFANVAIWPKLAFFAIFAKYDI